MISKFSSTDTAYMLNISRNSCRIFWEGHKILQNLYHRFDRYYIGQIYDGDFAKNCGLLRIYELSQKWNSCISSQSYCITQVHTYYIICNLIFNSKWNLMLLYSPYSLHHSIFKWNEWNVSPRLFLISSLLVLLMYYLFFIWKSSQLEPQYGLIVVYIAYDQNKTENSILKKM